MLAWISSRDPETIVHNFYRELRREIMEGNTFLSKAELALLKSHYATLIKYAHHDSAVSGYVYCARRIHPVRDILADASPFVLDAGCGYASESFLFAALGARVLAVDRPQQIAIAKKRLKYYEKLFDRSLSVEFIDEDLNEYRPPGGLTLTWLASVLAAIPDQDDLIKRIYFSTGSDGKIMITDMNIINPLFMLNEWRRRRRAMRKSPEFSKQADFWAMVARKNRMGARYYPCDNGGIMDDVQFFSANTLSTLLESIGFNSRSLHIGYLPIEIAGRHMKFFDSLLMKIPLVSSMGYFYLVTGVKK
jgi:SAM-dependent methyltransferase